MKKTIIFLLILIFIPITEGKEKIQGREIINRYFEDKVNSKDRKNDVNETENTNKLYGVQPKNDEPKKKLNEELEKALDEALKKFLRKAIERVETLTLKQNPEPSSKQASEQVSKQIPDQTSDQAIDKALNKALVKAIDKALDTTLEKVLDKTLGPKPGNISVSVWVGYGYYEMNEFNRKLSGEGNKTIDGGLNVGMELPFKGLKVGGLELSPFPIGAEYLEACSKTTHITSSARITVDWELPVVGVYFWPEVQSSKLADKWRDDRGWDLRLRPLGVGYYTLGKVIDAELDLSDSKGYLEVEDETIGIMSQIGIEYVNDKKDLEVYVESGYRSLKFTSVMRKPKCGFAGGSPSTMPEDLDYSGFIIKAGLCKRF